MGTNDRVLVTGATGYIGGRLVPHLLAARFAEAAETSGLGRIVYLGGLGELGDGLSEHLASRREVERVLASGKAPVTVLRAAMIIGAGSASFEILRYLVEQLPVMVTPKWVKTECEPIAIRNVLQYLVDCLTVPQTVGRTLDVGGPDWAGGTVFTDRRSLTIEAPASPCSGPSAGSGAGTAGTPRTSSGASGAFSTGSWEAPACGADGATPRTLRSGSRSTSGG